MVEYWSADGRSVKLMNTENPVTALEHYYEAEKADLIKCTSMHNSKPTNMHHNESS